jgi:hypothetical protein
MTRMAHRRAFVFLRRQAAWALPCLCFLWAVLPAPRIDGHDLFPVPDAEEYALIAQRLAHGRAPLLAVGLQEYPPRYALAFPLFLAPFERLMGDDLTRLHWVAALAALAAVWMMARVGAWMLGSRWAGGLAAMFWALHVQTVEASLAVMSETTLTLGFFAALALGRPWLEPGDRRRPVGVARAAALGLVLGWLTLAKAPFAWWAAALAALALRDGLRRRRWAPFAALTACGLAWLALDVAYRRWALGGFGHDGYAYWFPLIYSDLTRVFNPRYLWRPWSTAWTDGPNAFYYGKMLLGRTHDFYSPYMPWCVAAAVIGLFWPGRRGRPGRLLVALMAGWAVLGLAFCGTYFWQSPRFLLLWMPPLDMAAAWGLIRMPFWRPLRRRRLAGWPLARWGQVAALAAILVLARGEIWRVRGLEHAPDDARRLRLPYSDQVQSLLARVPEGALLATNYQLPLVDALRPHPGPTVALNAWPEDGYYMNGHAEAIWHYKLAPRGSRPAMQRRVDPMPAAWRSGPSLLISPEDLWLVSEQEFRALLARPFYALVLKPVALPSSGRHFDATIRPMLAARARLEPIQSTPDVTLYALAPPANPVPRPGR